MFAARAAFPGRGPVVDPDQQVAEMSEEEDEKRGTRRFVVHAIDVDIVYNRFGQHQPNGAMFVLEENLEAAREASGEAPRNAFDFVFGDDCSEDGCDDVVDPSVIEPLVIRANAGEVVEIEFHNHLDQHASMHQTALPYELDTSDGLSVGYNEDTTVPPGESTTYRWHAVHEGTHYFRDGVSQAWDSTPDGNPEEINNLARGLFGAIIVEPEGATWTDPKTGDPLRSGVKADIHDPNGLGTHYREFAVFYHDPGEVLNDDGSTPTWHDSDTKQSFHGINYRGDQTGVRIQDRDDCEDCEDPSMFYSSWIHGDPGGGDLVFPTYSGDPVKLCVVGGNLEENHSHHLHNHRWNEIPGDGGSDTIDAQAVGPGTTYETYLVVAHNLEESDVDSLNPDMTFEEAFEVGAGYVHDGVGDALMHCHLFPHYAEGMSSIMRVEERRREDLQPLPNNDPKKEPGELAWPDFVPPGEKGERPLESPDPELRPYEALTRDEQAAVGRDIVAGAPYSNPVYQEPEEVREYTLHAVEADIVYNDAGDHDPEGLVYVEDDDYEAVVNGDMNPEPLFIRANVGDVVEITMVNHLDNPVSFHPHFISFDVQGSDSLTNGYNYDQGCDPGQRMHYRWFCDEEGTIFFHDHMSGIEEGMHGTFAALIVEPENSEWYDPYSGEPIRTGAQAMIEKPDGESFREQVLEYHNFAPLKKDDGGGFVNNRREHDKNAGVGAINYRNAPYYHRDDCDPAYVHSSAVHGDPPTPTLEMYPDDQLRIRLVQAPWEEQHNFAVHGLDVDSFGFDPRDVNPQLTTISRGYTFRVSEDDSVEYLDGPSGVPVRDYLYGSTISDNLWNGMWGTIRVWGKEVDHLRSLPGSRPPPGKITEKKLRDLGHPAPHSDFDWTEYGQKAALLYGEDDCRDSPPDKDERQNGNIGYTPQPASSPGHPCPDDAEVRRYEVTAFQTDIEFNDYGDHDPHGIVFALDEHVEDIEAGSREPEPLTLRANEGECVEVTLTNDLPEDIDNDHTHPEMRADREWERSNRISLHPLNVTYDVQGSDGATVGFNFDQTVAPGESITYRWYADEQNDGCVLWDMADVRSHRHHGAFGQLIVEPPDSVWLDSRTGEPVEGTGRQTMIKTAYGNDFREFALSMSDGRFIVNDDDAFENCVVPLPEEEAEGTAPEAEAEEHGPDPCNAFGDPEDQGYVAVNNRAEPFIRRFECESDAQHEVFSSEVHGDPATPVFNAFLDDPVTFRFSQTADKERGISFHLAGHEWKRFRGTSNDLIPSPRIGVEGDITPGKSHNIAPFGGAGGVLGETGDFIYSEMKLRRRLEAGWWGIFRVQDDPREFCEPVQPLPDRSQTVPLHERPGWVVLEGDVTGSGRTDVVVLVPDSVHGPCDASTLYLFEDVRSHSEVTDLSVADHRAFLQVDETQLVVTVDESAGLGPSTLLQMLRNTDLEVLGCPHDYTVDVDDVNDLEELKLQVVGPDGDESWELEVFPESVDCTTNAITITWEDGSTFTLAGCEKLFD